MSKRLEAVNRFAAKVERLRKAEMNSVEVVMLARAVLALVKVAKLAELYGERVAAGHNANCACELCLLLVGGIRDLNADLARAMGDDE